MSTRLEDIYRHLKSQGVEVYFPGQKVGECRANYVVVKESDTSQYQGLSSTATVYEVLCYVPRDRYSQLSIFSDQVKEIMKKLYPMIRPLYNETPPFYEDLVKAHMKSIQYMNIRKIIR